MTAAKKAGERGELTGGRLLWPGAHGSGGTRDEGRGRGVGKRGEVSVLFVLKGKK